MRKILCSPSLAYDSAHVKYGVWSGRKILDQPLPLEWQNILFHDFHGWNYFPGFSTLANEVETTMMQVSCWIKKSNWITLKNVIEQFQYEGYVAGCWFLALTLNESYQHLAYRIWCCNNSHMYILWDYFYFKAHRKTYLGVLNLSERYVPTMS